MHVRLPDPTLSPPRRRSVALAIAWGVALASHAQADVVFAGSEIFIDETLGLAVAHVPDPGGRIDSTAAEIGVVLGGKRLSIAPGGRDLSRERRLRSEFDGRAYALYLTSLPVFAIAPLDSIVDEPKRPASWTYVDADGTRRGWCGIEVRGGSTQQYDKKTYDLELWDDPEGSSSTNESFAGLRRDDDWILDALYNEPLRLRSHVAHRLWLDLHVPHYRSDAPEARAGADVRFVEVFVGGSYRGVYNLSEQVDRKLLQLERPASTGEPRGELWKGSSWGEATQFLSAPTFSPRATWWHGQEAKYPADEPPVVWDDLWEATELVTGGSDGRFARDIAAAYALDNVGDYYLFLNLLYALDNNGKNVYTARVDRGAPYFFVPWDLDGVFGLEWRGLRVTDAEGILTGTLYERLREADVDGYNRRLADRWGQLREGILDTDALQERFRSAYGRFARELLYEREALTAGNAPFDEEELAFTLDWIARRVAFLDRHFAAIGATSGAEPRRGPEGGLTVVPNPFGSTLTALAPPGGRTPARYALYDVSGVAIASGRVPPGGVLEFGSVRPGAYVLETEDADGLTRRARVVKR